MASNIVGRVTQVLGAVVDVQFPGELPFIQNALRCKIDDRTLVLEVAPRDQVVDVWAWPEDRPRRLEREHVDRSRWICGSQAAQGRYRRHRVGHVPVRDDQDLASIELDPFHPARLRKPSTTL